jgi:oxygen-dependent protoporphyrinogen oxidase
MVVIIGGGISGLATAYQLEKKGISYLLLEASNRLGGLVSTHKTPEGYQYEGAPNTLLADEAAFDLIEELGLTNEVVYPNAVSENRYVFKAGRLRQLPDKPLRLLTSRFFSLKTKIKILQELKLKPVTPDPNETLASFGRRHFGPEVVDYALAPFVLGIYGCPPHELLTRLTFPQLQAWEAEYGSIIKAMKATAGNTARKKSINFNGGLQTLTQTLVSKLTHTECNAKVTEMQPIGSDGGWKITYNQDNATQTIEADAVVFASGLKTVSGLLGHLKPSLSALMAAVPHKSMVGIHTVWPKDSSYHFDGFGALNPPVEHKITGGSIWVSSVFPDRTPADTRLLTTFAFPNEADAAQLKQKDSLFITNLVNHAIKEMREIYGFENTPLWHTAIPWFEVLPQYGEALAKVWDSMHQMPEAMYVNANWYEGISLNDSLKKAVKLANLLEQQAVPA